MRRQRPSHDADAHDNAPSKTQIKDQMHALKALGAALLDLPAAKLDELEMPERLRDALREYHRIPTMNAKARQLSFIGKLMRSADPEPLRRAIEEQQYAHLRQTQSLRDAERWRDRLLSDDQAFTAWCAAHPGGDTRALRALIAKARREQAQIEAAAPDGIAVRKGPVYRELFQELVAVLKKADDKTGE